MKITHETPIPLILESLKGNPGWKVIEERLMEVRDQHFQILLSSTAETSHLALVEQLAFIKGINRILREPELLEREWKAAKKAHDAHEAKLKLRAQAYEHAPD